MVVKEPTKITKYWPIYKILEAVPASVEVMMELGLNCFACSANQEELLHEGLAAHGMSDEQIDIFVDEVNKLFAAQREAKMIKPQPDDFNIEIISEGNKKYYKLAGLMIDEAAYEAVHKLNEESKAGLQIRVEAGGCNGYSYIYEYQESPEEDEKEYILSDTLKIFMSDFSFDKLHGSAVSYESGLKGSGLIFKNPNTKDECHCGASVGF